MILKFKVKASSSGMFRIPSIKPHHIVGSHGYPTDEVAVCHASRAIEALFSSPNPRLKVHCLPPCVTVINHGFMVDLEIDTTSIPEKNYRLYTNRFRPLDENNKHYWINENSDYLNDYHHPYCI